MTKLEDKMGRLLAWLVDEQHLVPKVSSEIKEYIKQYMKEALTSDTGTP